LKLSDSIEIFNESCLDSMKRMEDKSIDLIITSPPYNMRLRVSNGKYVKRPENENHFTDKYEGFDDALPIDEFYNLHFKIIKEMLRISKLTFYNIQIVSGSKQAFFKLIGDFYDKIKDIIIWDKGFGQPAINAGVLNRSTELIIVFDDEKAIRRTFDDVNFARGTLSDKWLVKRGTVCKEHSATFPKKLVEKILDNFSKDDFIIYDPFMGSGTTGVVCSERNLKFIGSEMTNNYFELSKRNLISASNPTKLF